MTITVPPRERRGKCQVIYDATPVHVRGDKLGKILWRGRQWAVTEHGIEKLDGTYFIAADRVQEHLFTENYGGWPCHVCQKNWADGDDFITAWLIALTLHSKQRDIAKAVRKAVAIAHPQREKIDD